MSSCQFVAVVDGDKGFHDMIAAFIVKGFACHVMHGDGAPRATARVIVRTVPC